MVRESIDAIGGVAMKTVFTHAVDRGSGYAVTDASAFRASRGKSAPDFISIRITHCKISALLR